MHTEFWWGHPEGNRALWRLGRKWEENIKMDLQEMEYEYINCIDLAQDRDWWQALVNAVRNLRFPYIAGYFLCS
jgi:hypothetical protein